LADHLRGRRARDIEIVRGLGEAPPINHPREQPHSIEPIHRSFHYSEQYCRF
jgi:hypothetical protein